MQDSEGAQCVPAARPADAGLHLQWNMFGMQEVERPASVLVAALHHGFDGFPEAAVGFDACIAQIIESTQNVVVPKRGYAKRSQRLSMMSPVRSERNMRRSSR